MDFETIKKDNRKYWVIGCLVTILLASVVFFVGTRANYKVTQKVNIANGIINYNQGDLKIMAIKVQNSSGEYDEVSSVPSSGYTLNKEKSICKVGENEVNIPIEYKGKVYVGVQEKGTKCTLYFDKGIFKTKDLILSQNINDSSRMSGSFTNIYEEDTNGRIFNSIDDDGETYFFAGSNPNNWVKFGKNKEGKDLYWRIIRINGDESIRIIYNGTTTDQTGSSTQIGTSTFNEKRDDNAYVGFMYGSAGSTTYFETHTNTNSSTIKTYLDNWYEENLKENYEQYISTEAGFCGDRIVDSFSLAGDDATNYNGVGIGFERTIFLSFTRTRFNSMPSYSCLIKNDLYTVSSSNKGNKALTYPVGLITADEISYAGGMALEKSNNFWLKTGQNYWTMSPNCFNGKGDSAYLIAVSFLYGSIIPTQVSTQQGVRPVINLKSDVLLTGSGTTSNPYTII